MALVVCSECGASVSSKAAACAKCGNPIAEARARPATTVRRAGSRWEGVGAIAVVMGLVMLLAGVWRGAALAGAGLVVFIIGRFK